MNASPNREVALFSAALELAPSERTAYLHKACADDPTLRQRLDELLRVHEDAITFLENKPPLKESLQARGDVPIETIQMKLAPAEKPGDRIGRYKLLQQIGEGGCGVVYTAEQEQPVRRRVALKVIKLGMDTRQVVARFEAERQALALMDHPNIAKVLDAGATDAGRPYFVMELVRGIKITDYCDENRLSTEERLKLFILVCQAVQHAHQKGVIHRDIKPSNILVASDDGVPVPKVIDFGIAKATQGRLTDQTLFTALEQFIGTPAYMSPEQAELTMHDVDTRTDIYSLGVLLYELLTGKTPLDQQELLSAGLDEMRRTIREKEPVRPSTRLSTMLVDELTTTAKHRRTDSPKLVHLLRGDLDWIVMKALEKDRARRYETANGLANDVQRHLTCEPVIARPPSRVYEFQKTVRRHKFGFAAAGAVGAALVLGMIGSALEAARARRAEREQSQLRQQAQDSQRKSQMEAAKATAISEFLQQLLGSANPDALKGSEYTVRQLLDDFSASLAQQLEDPEVEATVRTTIGRAYYRLGFADKAQTQLERALALRRRVFGNQAEQVAESLVDNAWVYFEQNQFKNGEPYVREALDIYRQRGTAVKPVIAALWALQKLVAGQDRAEETDSITTQALTLAAKTPGLESPELASMLHGLAELRIRQSRYREAEELAQKAVAMHRRLRREGDLETAWALVALGTALRSEGKLDEAERTLQEAFGNFRRQYAPGHKSVDAAITQLKLVLEAKGDTAGLASVYQQILAEQRATFGSDNAAVAETLMDLADALQAQGSTVQSEKASAEAREIILRLNKHLTATTPPLVRRQAAALKSRGKFPDAQRLFESAITVAGQNLGETNFILGDLLNDYGNLLEQENKFQAAAQYHLKALSIRRARPDNDLCWTLRNLADELLWTGKPQEAEAYYREALELYCKLHQREDVNGTAWLTQTLGDALDRQHKLPEAELAYRQALAIYARCNALPHDDCARAVRLLLGVLKEEEKLAEREALGREILNQQQVACTNDNAASARALSRFLGEALQELGMVEEGVRVQREAIHTYARLKEAAPTTVLYCKKEAFGTWMLAITLEGASRFDEAESEYRRAVSLYEKASVDFPMELVLTEHLGAIKGQLAELVRWRRRLLIANSVYREAAEHGDAAQLNECAWFFVTCTDPSVRDVIAAADFAEKAVAATSRTNAGILDTLAATFAANGQFDRAIRIQEEAVAASQTEQEKRDLGDVIISYEHKSFNRGQPPLAPVAAALMSMGKLAETEEWLCDELSRLRPLTTNAPSGETSELGLTLHHLADVLRRRKALAEARSCAEEAIAVYRRHPDWPFNERRHAFIVLDAVLTDLGDFSSLEPLLEEQLQTSRSRFASDDPELAAILARLTSTLLAENNYSQAEPFARECLSIREKKLPDDWRTFNTRSMLGEALLGLKKYPDAEPLLLSGYDGMKQRQNKIPATVSRLRLEEAVHRVVQLYEATNRPNQAKEWKQKLVEFEQSRQVCPMRAGMLCLAIY